MGKKEEDEPSGPLQQFLDKWAAATVKQRFHLAKWYFIIFFDFIFCRIVCFFDFIIWKTTSYFIGDTTITRAQQVNRRIIEATHKNNEKVRILTHNTWFHWFAGGPYRIKRLNIFVDCIRAEWEKKNGPHVIVLQEMFAVHFNLFGFHFTVSEYEYLFKRLLPMGFLYHTKQVKELQKSTKNTLFPNCVLDHGLVIFSQYPITHYSEYVFNKKRRYCHKGWTHQMITIPVVNFIERKEDKNKDKDKDDEEEKKEDEEEDEDEEDEEEALIKTETRTISLVNTHLEHKLADVKISQIKELSAFIQMLRKKNEKERFKLFDMSMCMGDFNACSNYTWGKIYDDVHYHMKMCGVRFDCFEKTSRTYRKDLIPFGVNEQHGSYDHVFVDWNSKQIRVSTEIKTYNGRGYVFSDHLGLVTEFVLSHFKDVNL